MVIRRVGGSDWLGLWFGVDVASVTIVGVVVVCGSAVAGARRTAGGARSG